MQKQSNKIALAKQKLELITLKSKMPTPGNKSDNAKVTLKSKDLRNPFFGYESNKLPGIKVRASSQTKKDINKKYILKEIERNQMKNRIIPKILF